MNYLPKSLFLALLVIAMLISIGWVNDLLNNPLDRKIDLLSDIRPSEKIDTKLVQAIDTISAPPTDSLTKIVRPEEEPKSTGPVYLEDFTENRNGLKHFSAALQNNLPNKVRIAFFGDSFIEGDILCGSFRDTLQGIFGGKGVGYVPIASEVAQYRMSIKHTFEEWETYSLVNKKKPNGPIGFAGYCFEPLLGNSVTYQTPRKASLPFAAVRLFYISHTEKSFQYTIQDTVTREMPLERSASLAELELPISTRKVELKFPQIDSLYLYGASFENGAGIYVDNFAMRGNSGMGLSLIQEDQLQQFNHFQNYKLILLQYGLNVVNEKDSLGYRWYVEKMVKTIEHLKSSMPESDFVLISVSDRSSNQNGTFATIPAIPRMRDAQRQIAQRTKIMFWDLYTAMGGSGTMVNYVNAIPPLAAKDYTHLTYKGGSKIAVKLANAILHELRKYEKGKHS